MADQWGKAYVQLGLRIDRLFHGYVDGYFGPPTWKAEVDGEPEPLPADLVEQAASLAEALPAQGYEVRRTEYLARQIQAMETTCRKLNGEQFSLQEEVHRCFDILPERTDEARFEEAHSLYEQALPGPGSLADRIQARRLRYELPREKNHLLPGLMARAMAEVRRRTAAFVELPEGEGVEIRTVEGQPWSAYNWYLGNCRSRIEMNTDLPVNLANLVDLMAHEGYPGHHAEHLLKEQLLWRERGYAEHSILLINTPECVISEGIATVAQSMIFAPGEAGRWLAKQIFPEAGMEPDGADPELLGRAAHLLKGVSGNACFMLHADGRSDDEVAAYVARWSLLPEERARKALQFYKSPLWRAYTFTYYYGRQLMEPLLGGEDRLAVFRRLLTEQTYPALLVEWSKR